MDVLCEAYDCRYNSVGKCCCGVIGINEDCECEEYESYLDMEEWRKPFWKRMKDDDNNCICRVRYYGKEIEVKGRKFFIESKSVFANTTDAITGFGCGQRVAIAERIDKIIEMANKVDTPLSELPIATFDEKTRKFSYGERKTATDTNVGSKEKNDKE